MNSESTGKKASQQPASKEDRLAEALRANLRRRKAQTKGRKQAQKADDAPDRGED